MVHGAPVREIPDQAAGFGNWFHLVVTYRIRKTLPARAGAEAMASVPHSGGYRPPGGGFGEGSGLFQLLLSSNQEEQFFI